jgi:hypothetical protein
MADFEPITLTLPPGVIKGQSDTVARDRYVDTSLVRWWQDLAQKWDGWTSFVATSLSLPARGVVAWIALDGTPCLAWGTAEKLWLWRAGVIHDITPTDEEYVAGFVDTQTGAGWGEDGWGEGGWGGGYAVDADNGGRARTWMLATWGQDLLANPRGGGIYHWAFTNGSPGVAALIEGAPPICLGIFVTDDRHLIALGASVGSTLSPLRIAWPNRETLDEWTPDPSNTAGDMLLESGVEIIGWSKVRDGYIILTDTSLHTLKLVGGNDVFGINRKGSNAGIIAPHAIVESNGIATWMGPDGFYTYNGVINVLPCDIHDHIFEGINRTQVFKVCAGTNTAFNEIIWFYPSTNSAENDVYATVNMKGQWANGTLARTSWLDQSAVIPTPIATEPGGTIYRHDVGKTADGEPMTYRLATGDVALKIGPSVGAKENFTLTRSIIPDFDYISGSHSLTIEARERPMSTHYMTKGPYAFTSSTAKIDAKARGRAFRLIMEGTGDFRMGAWIAYGRPDGGR